MPSHGSKQALLGMRVNQRKQVLLIRTDALDISPEAASELLQYVRFVVNGTVLDNGTLRIEYSGCTAQRIKQNVFMKLEQHIRHDRS